MDYLIGFGREGSGMRSTVNTGYELNRIPVSICLEMFTYTIHKAVEMVSRGKKIVVLIVSSGERSIHSSIVVMGRSESRNDGEDGWRYISGGSCWSNETQRKSIWPTTMYFTIALEYTD